jgi:hypothetical protein
MKTSIICNPAAGSMEDCESIHEKLQKLPDAQIYFTEKVINGIAAHADRIRIGTRFAKDAIEQVSSVLDQCRNLLWPNRDF